MSRLAYYRDTLGFDRTTHVPFTKQYSIGCSQCEALVINGVACHETGCPNDTHGCAECDARIPKNQRVCESCQYDEEDRAARPHCATCGCDLHDDGECPEGCCQTTDDEAEDEPVYYQRRFQFTAGPNSMVFVACPKHRYLMAEGKAPSDLFFTTASEPMRPADDESACDYCLEG